MPPVARIRNRTATNFVCVVFAGPIGPGDRRDIFAEIALQEGSENFCRDDQVIAMRGDKEAVAAERGDQRGFRYGDFGVERRHSCIAPGAALSLSCPQAAVSGPGHPTCH